MRIREVVKDTGVSRELIHHYLRQGLIPHPERPARYTEQQVELLKLLKKLREDHHLPLELIRRLFDLYDFVPSRLAPFTLSDSLHKRVEQFLNGGEVLSESLSAEEVIRRTGMPADRLSEYGRARLVQPFVQGDRERYSLHDVNVVTLCERGIALGIPFDSLRTIGAYVRVAFELEYKAVFETARRAAGKDKGFLGEILVQREVITGFIQNLLQSLIASRLRDIVSVAEEIRATLDHVVYRPSSLFIKRHRLEGFIESRHEELVASPRRPELWIQTSRAMLHAGRYREAIFFVEQALEKWPGNAGLASILGRALILSGQHEQGRRALEPLREKSGRGPVDRMFLALSLLGQAGEGDGVDPPVANAANLLNLTEEALGAAGTAPSSEQTLEVRMLAGWIFSVLPSALRDLDRSRDLLAGTLHELERGVLDKAPIPGLRERYLINAAYLLFQNLNRSKSLKPGRAPDRSVPSPEALRSLVCSLDPGCRFAQEVFLLPEASRKTKKRRKG